MNNTTYTINFSYQEFNFNTDNMEVHIYPQKHIAEKVSQYLYQQLFAQQGWPTVTHLQPNPNIYHMGRRELLGLVKFDKVQLALPPLWQSQLFNKTRMSAALFQTSCLQS